MSNSYLILLYKTFYHVLIISIYKQVLLSKVRMYRDEIRRHVSNNCFSHLVALVHLVNHNNLILQEEIHLNLFILKGNP